MKTPTFTFTKEQLELMKSLVREYCTTELEIEIGDLQSGLFVDFLHEKIGRYYYNRGIVDAQDALQEKIADLSLLLKE